MKRGTEKGQSQLDALLCPPEHASSEHLSIHQLEMLTAQEDTGARDHLSSCSKCSNRFAEIEAEKRSLMLLLPPEKVTKDFVPVTKMHHRFWPWAVAAATSVCFIIVGVMWPSEEPPGKATYKGQAAMRIVVQRGDNSWLAQSGEGFRAGDRLRFSMVSAGDRYVRLLSRIGTPGAPSQTRTTSLFPVKAREPEAFEKGWVITSGDRFALSEDLLLDDECEQEWLLLLLSEQQLSPQRAETLADEVEIEIGGVLQLDSASGIAIIGFDITRSPRSESCAHNDG